MEYDENGLIDKEEQDTTRLENVAMVGVIAITAWIAFGAVWLIRVIEGPRYTTEELAYQRVMQGQLHEDLLDAQQTNRTLASQLSQCQLVRDDLERREEEATQRLVRLQQAVDAQYTSPGSCMEHSATLLEELRAYHQIEEAVSRARLRTAQAVSSADQQDFEYYCSRRNAACERAMEPMWDAHIDYQELLEEHAEVARTLRQCEEQLEAADPLLEAAITEVDMFYLDALQLRNQIDVTNCHIAGVRVRPQPTRIDGWPPPPRSQLEWEPW